jgi:cyclase
LLPALRRAIERAAGDRDSQRRARAAMMMRTHQAGGFDWGRKIMRYASVALSAIAATTLLVATAAAQQPDFDAVQIKVHPVAGTFYYLEGQGGNIGLSVGDDGIVMIDDQFAPLSQKILAAIRGISDKPIKFLINTHMHPDHIGGNENFGGMGITILAQDNVRIRMARGIRGGPPAPAVALPIITFTHPVTIHMNGEDVSALPMPPAHTDGDTYIYFRGSNVIHMGDVFRTTGYPVIDRENGGTLAGTLDALQQAIDMAGPDTKIVPGHGVVSSREDVRTFRDMILDVRDRVSRLVSEGKTLEEVIATKPTADLDAEYGSPDRFLPAVYQELKGS